MTGVETRDGVIAAERVILAGGVGQGALAGLAGIAPPVGGARHHVFVTSPAPELAAGPLPMGFDVEAGLYWRQEEGGLLFGISDPGEAPGEARGIDEATQHARARAPGRGSMPMTRGARAAQGLGGDHRLHARPPADHRALPLARDGEADRGAHAGLGGRPRDECGDRRWRASPSTSPCTARPSVTDVSFLGVERFDAAGRSSLAADPIALPFPATAGP